MNNKQNQPQKDNYISEENKENENETDQIDRRKTESISRKQHS